jgi:ammonium transporter, Amt family
MLRSSIAGPSQLMSQWRLWFAALFLTLAPAASFAQTPVVNSGDTAWLITASALVLFMTIPGLALFYGGLVRKKNIVSTLMQCFVIACLVAVLWVVAGYSLAFGPMTNGWVGDLSNAFLQNLKPSDVTGTIPTSVFIMYQMTFAIITPALIIGSFVERMKFSGMLVFMALWSLLVYAPIAHMVWGGGLLAQWGVLDFAGGAVVHINAGVAGLVACLMLGKRKEWPKNSELFHPSNITYTMVGASMLWVGWFGFNAGSALAANGQAGMAMLNTQVAAAVAALSWMITEWLQKGKPSLVGISCGAVAGLVAITPAAGFVGIPGALMIGLVTGPLCLAGCTYLKEAFGYDDSLDVVGVHGIGGFIGAILAGVFAVAAVGGKSGWIEGNSAQVLTQFYGSLFVVAYSAVVTAAILFVTKMTVGIRVAPKDEDSGLDLSAHGEKIA